MGLVPVKALFYFKKLQKLLVDNIITRGSVRLKYNHLGYNRKRYLLNVSYNNMAEFVGPWLGLEATFELVKQWAGLMSDDDYTWK